jgi:HEAT repeat protein
LRASSAINDLKECLDDVNEDVRMASLTALGCMGPAAEPALLAAAAGKDQPLAAAAKRILETIALEKKQNTEK